MEIKPGMRLFSTACNTEVVVVRGSGDVDLACGGLAMAETAINDKNEPADGFNDGSLLGKRYEDVESGIELLCVVPGAGSLSVAGRVMQIKAAKALPSSD